MAIFDIDADIRRAKTLSSEFYTDPRYFELSKEKIFVPSWQLCGHVNEFTGLTPRTLLAGLLDEPVVVVKNGESLQCLSNVCTHRGKILVDEPCQANLIRCSYHGRRFSLDGKFLSMPEFEDVVDFPSASDDLKRLPFSEWSGFWFASIAPAAPLDEFVHVEKIRLDDTSLELALASTREYAFHAHWALYCENYLEGFHIPYVHKALNEALDYGSYRTETFRYSSLQTALSEPPAVAGGLTQANLQPPATAGGSDLAVAARYLFIFPNLMFNFYPWGVSVNVVRPVSPSNTIVEFLTYVSDESKLDKGAGADLHGVELEDEAVVESVQRGIRSRFYTHGRYSPTREQGTHHFHRLIAEFMNS